MLLLVAVFRAGALGRGGRPECHRASCRFTTGAFGVVDATHVRLPRIGVVRCHETTLKLAERMAAGTARILAATISLSATLLAGPGTRRYGGHR